jgi:hypothetical protein
MLGSFLLLQLPLAALGGYFLLRGRSIGGFLLLASAVAFAPCWVILTQPFLGESPLVLPVGAILAGAVGVASLLVWPRRTRLAVAILMAALVMFSLFVPVLRLDTDARPQCALSRRGPMACPFVIDTDITGHAVYWSISSYYLGVGAYFVTPSSYGILP